MVDNQQELTENVRVENSQGIHARPAAMIAKVAHAYPDTEINLIVQGRATNAKSVMNLMLLAVNHGEQLQLKVAGPSAKEAMQALKEIFTGKFNEK